MKPAATPNIVTVARICTPHHATVAFTLGDEENAIWIGECEDVDGLFELWWKRVEREYFPLGKWLACDHSGSCLGFLVESVRTELTANGIHR